MIYPKFVYNREKIKITGKIKLQQQQKQQNHHHHHQQQQRL